MMKIFSNEDIKAIEQATFAGGHITPDSLVRAAGESLACEIEAELQPGAQVIVFAGPERCGAYALEATSRLRDRGLQPDVYLFNIHGNRLNAECRAARDRFVEEWGVDALNEITGIRFVMPDITADNVVIDGIFGTELSEPVAGGYQEVVRHINDSGARVIAVDVPSGLPSDYQAGLISRNVIHADVTLGVGMPRVAFFMKENAELIGFWRPVQIDYDPQAVEARPCRYRLVERADVRGILPRRMPYSSKADYGSAIIFAGSYGMMGAAVLAARAATRAGCGKVTCCGPRCGYYVMQSAVPSALFDVNPGDVLINRFELNRHYDAVAIGPGIGTADVTIDALDTFLKIANANSRPLVLDADALNCMAIRPSMLAKIPVLSVLTPHEVEFDRLFGDQPSGHARLLKAIEVSAYYQIIIVLKGHHTAVVRPDGKVYFNTTGTPAMAAAGSGDVLTGILVSLMAQGISPELAAVAAVYIHGRAGELAEEIHGQYGVTADDIAECTGRAIKLIMQ